MSDINYQHILCMKNNILVQFSFSFLALRGFDYKWVKVRHQSEALIR